MTNNQGRAPDEQTTPPEIRAVDRRPGDRLPVRRLDRFHGRLPDVDQPGGVLVAVRGSDRCDRRCRPRAARGPQTEGVRR